MSFMHNNNVFIPRAGVDPSDSRSPLILHISWVEFALATALIVLRIYTKIFVARESGTWSLSWALAAWIFGLCDAIVLSISVHYGFGQHVDQLSASQVAHAIKWTWVGNVMTRIGLALGKAAVAAFLMNVQASTIRKWQRHLLIFLASSTILVNFIVSFIMMFQCDPQAALWDKSIPGDCAGIGLNARFGTFVVAWGGAVDITLAAYPAIYIVWGLKQVGWRTKLGLSILMGLGMLAAACSIVVICELFATANTTDPTYAETSLTIWGFTEMWVVIVVGSVPPTWPLINRPVRRLREVTKSQRNTGSGGIWSALGSRARRRYIFFGGNKPTSMEDYGNAIELRSAPHDRKNLASSSKWKHIRLDSPREECGGWDEDDSLPSKAVVTTSAV